MRKEIQLEKPLLEKWQLNPTTMQVWHKLSSHYRPLQNLRQCEPHKVEYYRAQADMMEELAKLFEKKID
jgi:hypothetical protein